MQKEMKVRETRPVLLLAALGGLTPTVGVAATNIVPGEAQRFVAGHSALSASVIVLAAIILLGTVALLVTGRMPWRFGVMAVIGCGVLLSGAAIIDDIETAIAVSS